MTDQQRQALQELRDWMEKWRGHIYADLDKEEGMRYIEIWTDGEEVTFNGDIHINPVNVTDIDKLLKEEYEKNH